VIGKQKQTQVQSGTHAETHRRRHTDAVWMDGWKTREGNHDSPVKSELEFFSLVFSAWRLLFFSRSRVSSDLLPSFSSPV